MGYSEQEQLGMIQLFYLNQENALTAQGEYWRKFPDRRTPTRMTILNTVKQLNERKVRIIKRNIKHD